MTLEVFYQENYPIVYGYLLSLCGNPALAEDLASETFLKAIQKIDSYDETCKPSTWLCTIAKNLYFNEYKRRKRYVSLHETEPSNTASMEETVLAGERTKFIWKTAFQLPESQRQVFFMRVQGMRFREIGDALGKTETWARVTYFRAKNQILERMEEYDGTL